MGRKKLEVLQSQNFDLGAGVVHSDAGHHGAEEQVQDSEGGGGKGVVSLCTGQEDLRCLAVHSAELGSRMGG